MPMVANRALVNQSLLIFKMKHFTNILHHIVVTRLSAILVILAVSLPSIVRAQVYPIQVVTEITPPYSVYLSDYTAIGTGKLAVNLLLTDVSRFNYPVKLRLVIEGEDVTITTSSSYMPEQIILDGGSPLRLSGDELAAYFNPKNLDFKGYSKEKFMQTGALPEGIYRIGFQALDYNKSIAVSLTGSATAWLVLNDPPIFNTPEKNAKLTASEPQNITFQWMPRHLGSPNSAFTTEYLFQLYEIWPDGRNPNEVVASTQPLLEKTSNSTTFLYSNTTETSLIPGRQYAYRVQARDVEERDLFRNKGYSEVQMFTYGDPCDVPTQITAQSTNSGKITINWQPATYNTAYYVQYREAGSTNGVWYPTTTYVNSLTIDNLNPKTKYEYQVQGQCGAVNSDFSEILNVTTQAKRETNVVCGLQDSATIITNKLPLTSLLPGDIITCGKFETQVTKASGGAGKWTGEGFMHVPFMGVKVRVTFTDVSINEKFQVTKGRIVSVYNIDSKNVVELNPKSNNNNTQQYPTSTTPKVSDTITINTLDTIVKTPGGDVLIISQTGDTTTIHRNADGSGVIINSQGDSTAIPVNQPVVVADAGGNSVKIDNDGNLINEKQTLSTSFVQKIVTEVILDNKFFIFLFDYNKLKFYYCSEDNIDLPESLVTNIKDIYKNYGEIEVIKSCNISSESKKNIIGCKRIFKNPSGYIFASLNQYEFQWSQNMKTITPELTKPYEFQVGESEIVVEKRKIGESGKFDKIGQIKIKVIEQQSEGVTVSTGDVKTQKTDDQKSEYPCNQGKSIYIDEKGDIIYEDKGGDKTFVVKTKRTQQDIYSPECINNSKAGSVSNISAEEQENVLKQMKKVKNGEIKMSDELQGYFIEIECITNIESMHNIAIKDNSKGGTNAKNNREYGGHILFAGSVIEDKSGEIANPCKDDKATIDITESGSRSSFHSHPSGTDSWIEISKTEKDFYGQPKQLTHTCEFEQGPSSVDVNNFAVSKCAYVFAMQEKVVYVYRKNMVVASFKFNFFNH
jgi:hypothetical protein